jgi:hypothetical protein
MARILLAQLDALRPDLVLNQDLPALSGSLLGEVRARTTALAGQHAAIPLPASGLDPYDLLVSSFPPTVDELRRRGHRAELSRLGFDPAVLDALGDAPLLRHGLTFVGSLAPIHSSRRSFLEELAQLVPDLRVWTPEPLPRSSSLRGRRAGAVWGREMFEVLRASRATLNHHGDVAPFANNMRLYEATGVGTVLLTDAKQNLTEIFDPGAEVLTFGSAAECAAVYAGLDDTTREAVATAGQRRTLRDHTYRARVEELLALL